MHLHKTVYHRAFTFVFGNLTGIFHLSLKMQSFYILFKWRVCFDSQSVVRTGAYLGGGAVRGAPPPWIFGIWRERALSLTTAIEKETERKKEKEEYRFWSYDGQWNQPPPPAPHFPPIYFSLSPFLPSKKNIILIGKYVSISPLKSD